MLVAELSLVVELEVEDVELEVELSLEDCELTHAVSERIKMSDKIADVFLKFIFAPRQSIFSMETILPYAPLPPP